MDPTVTGHYIVQAHLVYPPSSETGPAPTVVPITGHGIEVQVTAPDDSQAVVRTLGCAVEERLPTRDASFGQSVVLAPLDTRIPQPQIRVWLDEPEKMSPGPVPVTFPASIPAGQSRRFILTAHTKKHDVRWLLAVMWTCEGREGRSVLEMRTTAETGWVAYHADGTVTHEGKWFHPEPDRPGSEAAVEAEARARDLAGNGDSEAMFELGALLADRGDLTEAEHWFRASAKTGHAKATASVGWILQQKGNMAEAADWFQRAEDLD